MSLETVADPWLGTVLPGDLHVEQRISSVESLYRAQDHEGQNYLARFRRINRLATPPDWTTRASRLRAIRTRRLARFIRAIEHDEYAVLLSEHVEGERLRDMLRRRGPFAASDALAIAMQIAVVVESIHAAGLTHGRLNPRNITISMDEQGAPRVTVTCYGFASGLEPPRPEHGYLPEGSTGAAPSDDVFSIGAILFELLTCVTPTDGAVDPGLRDIAAAPLKNPSAINPSLRGLPMLDELVQRLTTDGDVLRIDQAIARLASAVDDPSSSELFVGPPSRTFAGVDTGLGTALSSSVVGTAAAQLDVERGGLRLEVRSAKSCVTMHDPQSNSTLLLVDIAKHGIVGHVSRLHLLGRDRLFIGTTRGALLSFDIDSAGFDTIVPASDGSAIVAIDATEELTVAATRRGSVICVTATDGHVMAPTALVTSLSVADSGRRFAVGRTSGDIEVYDIVDGAPVRIDEFSAAEVTGLRLSVDGSELWLSDRDTTTVRDLATQSTLGVVGAAHELVESSEALAWDKHEDD